MFHQYVQTGYVIFGWAFLVIVGIFTLASLFMLCVKEWFLSAVALGVAFVIAAIGVFALWPPLAPQYHTVVPYTGVVKAVGSRLLGSDVQGGGSTQVFPFQFMNGDIRRCDDSRCALVKPGDTVTLLCVRDFQFNAVPGWVCNWGKLGGNN